MAPRKGVDKAQMRFHEALILALSATCLSSCLVLPLHYHTRPDIYGTVAKNGMAVEGAKIGYSDDLSDVHCDSSGDSQPPRVVSDGNGAFHFEGTYSFFHIIYLEPGAAESVSGRICIDTSDGQHFSKELFMNRGRAVGSIPSASCDLLTIECDLTKDTCTGTAQ
jgi:hypothetical protein